MHRRIHLYAYNQAFRTETRNNHCLFHNTKQSFQNSGIGILALRWYWKNLFVPTYKALIETGSQMIPQNVLRISVFLTQEKGKREPCCFQGRLRFPQASCFPCLPCRPCLFPSKRMQIDRHCSKRSEAEAEITVFSRTSLRILFLVKDPSCGGWVGAPWILGR